MNSFIVNRNPPSHPEIVFVLKEVFGKSFPEANDDWFSEQIKDVELENSYFVYEGSKLVGIYLMKESSDPFGKMQGRGICGEVLAVLPEYQNKGIFTKIYKLLQQSEFDYFWGRQAKVLSNLRFWTKYRTVIGEDSERWYTAGYLKAQS